MLAEAEAIAAAVDTGISAGVEIAAGDDERAFASAVDRSGALTPSVLAWVGRRLADRGEAVLLHDVVDGRSVLRRRLTGPLPGAARRLGPGAAGWTSTGSAAHRPSTAPRPRSSTYGLARQPKRRGAGGRRLKLHGLPAGSRRPSSGACAPNSGFRFRASLPMPAGTLPGVRNTARAAIAKGDPAVLLPGTAMRAAAGKEVPHKGLVSETLGPGVDR